MDDRFWVRAAAPLTAALEQIRAFMSATVNVCSSQKLTMDRFDADGQEGALISDFQPVRALYGKPQFPNRYTAR